MPFSLSDRIRYYWPDPSARKAVDELYARLDGKEISEPVLSQFLPMQLEMKGADCHQLLVGAVKLVLEKYDRGISAKGVLSE